MKFTYSQISSWINSFVFRIHIDIITMFISRWVSVTPSQIRNEINNILDCYDHHRYLSPEEVIRAKLNLYHWGNRHYQNKNIIWNKTKYSYWEENSVTWLFFMIHTLTMSTTIIHVLTALTPLILAKTLISEAMIRSAMMSIIGVQILTTSKQIVQTHTTSTTLMQRKILVMLSYIIIETSSNFSSHSKYSEYLLCSLGLIC